MENAIFTDEENISMVYDEDDDERYDMPNASRRDEKSFIEPTDATEPTSTLRLRRKVKRDKINALYRRLNVAGNPDLIDLDRFRLTKDPKKGVTIFKFYNGNDRWVSLTKETGEFLSVKTLRDRFSGLNAMKNFVGPDKTTPLLERSVKAATKRKGELPTDLMIEGTPLEDLSSLAEEIHVKLREASQNTDLDMSEFLGIDKAFQSIQGELLNNTSKLIEINKSIKRDTKKLHKK